MTDNTLKIYSGVDFALLGTDLKSIYEKDDSEHAILPVPSEDRNLEFLLRSIFRPCEAGTGRECMWSGCDNK